MTWTHAPTGDGTYQVIHQVGLPDRDAKGRTDYTDTDGAIRRAAWLNGATATAAAAEPIIDAATAFADAGSWEQFAAAADALLAAVTTYRQRPNPVIPPESPR